jgi:hypothetical protein
MNLPAALFVIRSLIRDTFRQSLANRVFWLVLGLSGVVILFGLSIRMEGQEVRTPTGDIELHGPDDEPYTGPKPKAQEGTVVRAGGKELVMEGHQGDRHTYKLAPTTKVTCDGQGCTLDDLKPSQKVRVTLKPGDKITATKIEALDKNLEFKEAGQVTIGFGAFHTAMLRDRESEVRFLQGALAWYASSVGTLLLLVFTAGFLPEFLQPSAAAVLLVKPVPRWSLLVGKYLGVLVFVIFQATVFFGGTWVAMGLSTGVWLPAYLLCIPVLVLHFAIVYSASALLAVWTRSTVASVLGAIVFWLICTAMNYGYYQVLSLARLARESGPLPEAFRWLVDAGYWLLPKPYDLLMGLNQAVAGETFQDTTLKMAQDMGAWRPELSLLTSVLSTVVLLAIAARQFNTTEY